MAGMLGSRETGNGRIAPAGRGIAGTLHGIRRLSRAVVLALSCLLLLAGVVTQAPAQTPPTASFAWESQSAGEGSGTHDVRVWLLPAPTTDVTVAYTVGGTAAFGSDFSIANSGTLSVPANTATATIPVTIVDDSDQEPSETVVLTLVASTAYSVADPGTHTLKIGDNDTPVAFFPKGEQTVREGSGTHNVKIALDRAPSSDITIKYAVAGAPFGIHRGAAEAGSDYAALPGTVAVPAGATTATIPVTIIDDDDSEWDEAFALFIAKGEGYRTGPSPLYIHKHTLLIPANDSQAKVDFSGFWVDHGHYRSCCRNTTRVSEESRAHNIKVTLKPVPTTDITINYTVGGTATSGSDFTIPNSGALSVSAGANEAIIPVTVVDDSAGEFDETVVLTLAGGSGYRLGGRTWASVIIAANDGTPSKKMSFAAKSHIAGEGTGTHDVEVTFDPVPSAGITVNYTVGGTATSGSDFSIANSGTLSVPANTATATIPVTIVDDNAIEDRAETVVLTLVGSAGYVPGEGNRYGSTHTLTIADNDTQWHSGGPVVRVTGGATVAEGEALPFTVTAEPAPENDLKVMLYVLDIIPRNTFLPPSGEGPKYMTIPAGQSSAIYRVQTRDDNVDRDRGYHSHPVVSVYVSDFKGMRYKPYPHPHSRAVGYVRDNNPTIASLVRTGPGAVLEGDGTVFTVTLSRSLFGFEHVDVPLSISGAGVTASDWSLTKKSGRFVTLLDAGTASPVVRFSNFRSRVATLELVATADSQSENIETITVSLGSDAAFDEAGRWTNVGGGADPHATQNSFDVQAFDSPSVTVSPVPPRLMAEGAVAGFTLAASPAPRAPLTVEVTLTGTGGDGTTETRQVTIPTSGAAQLDIVAGDDDAGGSITATVKTGDGYMVGDPASGTVMVGNNDPPEPAVTVSAGTSPVTEGGNAVFTLTATPAPAADLAVSVTVATDGDWGVAAGSRTVTIPTSGSAVLTLATTGDAADEPDGSVSVTVTAGSGYTVGSSGSGTVSVRDDDDPAAACAARQTVVNHLIEVRDNPKNAAVKGNPVHIAKWNRVLEAIGHDTGTGLSPMPASEIHANAAQWPDSPFKAASDHLNCVEAQGGQGQDQPQQQDPEITVTADAASVTEGGDAAFTLTASPAPAADLSVTVTVATDGDWGVTEGSRTVTIPTSGSATLTLATAGDGTDEPDGSVTVTVDDGSGYTVGSSASGTVSVQDDDDPAAACAARQSVADILIAVRDNPPNARMRGNAAHIAKWNRVLEAIGHDTGTGLSPMPASDIHANAAQWPDSPFKAASDRLSCVAQGGQDQDQPQQQDPEITVTANAASVTEGGDAVFTLTANPAPAADLAVSVTVATDGSYGISAGTRTVTIPTTGSATLTLATAGDTIDEPDGSVTVTVADGSGYTVGSAGSGTVAVRDDDDPALPEVTLAAGTSPVTEGGDAVFTLTASPAPAADLAVSVSVAADGDWGVTAGTQTVTIPTTGSATLTLATTDDGADEPDGSVTATVQAGSGYTVGSAGSGTVAVSDDDLPPPVVTIAAKAASVAEGGDAEFTLTADRAPDSDITVTLAVSETGDGDHVAAADEGPATLAIPKGATEAVFTLATVNDDVDEPDGAVTVAVTACAGCTVGDPASASVEVTDDDAAALPVLSVGDATLTEGVEWLMPFTVRLSAAAPETVTVRVDTRDSTPVSATRRDYWPVKGRTVTFRPGETERTVTVLVYDDYHDEGPETFEVVLSDARGAAIGDGVAVGTIVNDDPLPGAWLARFGRTVAEQALDGIAARMAAPRTAGMQGSIAGQALAFGGGAADGVDLSRSPGPVSPGSLSGAGFGQEAQARGMTMREVLQGSSFSLTGEADSSGGTLAFWGGTPGSGGLVSGSRFAGDRRGNGTAVSLHGETATALLGTDYARGRWLVGFALSETRAEGGYAGEGGGDCSGLPAEACAVAVRAGDGEVEASLTATIPYAALDVTDRLRLWGAAGHGAGDVTVRPAQGGSLSADTAWSMAAAGLRGDLLAPAAGSGTGPSLSLTSDALWVRTSSEKTRGLAASESDVTRLRVGLEGSWGVALENGGAVTPKLELGARHDGGDAETGFGVELGGGLAWTDPGVGLSLDLSGRTLVAHDDGGLEDRGVSAQLSFDPSPASGRGLSLGLGQDWGGRSQGGLDALFQPEPLEDRGEGNSEAVSRWSMEAAYGLPAFGGRFTGSPYMGLGLATGARDYTLGWRLTPEAAHAPNLSFGLRATRRESDARAPEHTVGVEIGARW